ncbi:ROK family protein [Streptomyces sp. NPDC047009]|uniref:ROK family protein n=1 Tax=Streptomyces sp. NPDC047009 TaxID=3154496 RepID=UPI0033DE6996
MNAGRVVGAVDIGGSHAVAALFEVTARGVVMIRQAEGPLDAQAPLAELLGSITATIRRVDPPAGLEWAIAIPGPFDYPRGTGTFEGVGKFQSLSGVDLRAAFAATVSTRSDRIGFLNDAVAYGIGEWAATDPRPGRLVCVTLGTGVGSAFLKDGRAVEDGPDVPPRGWVHLLRIRARPLEETVSTGAIQAAYASATGVRSSVRDIAAAARAGDPAAGTVLQEAMRELGRALAPWFGRFGTDEVVIGGSISRSWDLIEAPLRAAIDGTIGTDRPTPTPMLRASRLLDRAPLAGAAEWILRETAERPGRPGHPPVPSGRSH